MARKVKIEDAGGKWSIARAHAYAVIPQRTTDTEVPPNGGILRLDDDLRTMLGSVLADINQRHFTPVDLQMDENSRTSAVREYLLEYSFGTGGQISKAGTGLGSLLGEAMDRRSTSGLLLVVVEKHPEDDERRRLTLLLFPQEKAFHFQASRDAAREAVLEVLDNVFSTGSKLRKVARFDGKNLKTQFLMGEVVDYQAGAATKSAADFWIGKFLKAKFRLNGEKGTHLLADGLRAAVVAAVPAEKEEVIAALLVAISTQQRTWSLEEFAESYLPESAREAFLKCAPNDETRRASFALDKRTLREKLQYRIFELETGVFVSAPLGQGGESVTIDGSGDRRVLHCQGIVVNEKVSASKA